MSSKDIAIKVENISKCYRIGAKVDKSENFIGAVLDFVKSPVSNYRKYKSLYTFDDIKPDGNGSENPSSDILWALNDVSFKVKQGEALGIIGANGAGKSTLLKILSKVVSPTTGRIEINGKFSSLLEVGTGFHPELTGRENVYLNGTILGMTKKEVDRKFDEIIEFSGVEKFIDTPVKRYSSGMTVRLAFAVAAHLEPEILIIDEVLAVGDISFQQKCLSKMNEVAREGRTVLFVSHNMSALENLCTTGIFLKNGKVVSQGDINSIISTYMKSTRSNFESNPHNWKHSGTGQAHVIDMQVLDTSNNPCSFIKMGDTVIVDFEVEFYEALDVVDDVTVVFKKADTGENVLHMQSLDCGLLVKNVSKGKRRYRVEIPELMLYPGYYLISIYLGARLEAIDYVRDVFNLNIVQAKVSERISPFYPSRAKYHQKSLWTERLEEKKEVCCT